MNQVHDSQFLKRFTEDFCAIVQKHCKYVIVSGYLAISSGRSRGTEDVDIIIPRLPFELFEKLHLDLLEKFSLYTLDNLDLKEAYTYLEENMNIRYVYKGSIIPNMEVKFAKNKIDFDNIAQRIKIPLTNTDVFFAPIECAIAYKEYLGSQKDIEDANHLSKVYAESISESKISYYRKLIAEVYHESG